MLTFPALRPVTCGWIEAVTEPCGMKIVAGETTILEISLLRSVIITPPAGAGASKVTGNAADDPITRFTLADRRIFAEATTFTVAVVSGKPGRALAWITLDAVPTLVMGRFRLLTPAGKVTVGGTVTALLVELR